MERREFNRLVGALAAAPLLTPRSAFASERRRWSLTADLAECCSCRIPCSCNFGRPVDTCFGNRLIQIREGDYEGASLAGEPSVGRLAQQIGMTFAGDEGGEVGVEDEVDGGGRLVHTLDGKRHCGQIRSAMSAKILS